MKLLAARRLLCGLLVIAMLGSFLPVPVVFAAEDEGLCEHHPAHDETCGYRAALAEIPCSHIHDDSCYTTVVQCVHEAHTDCAYAEPTGSPCNHQHDDCCGYAEAVEEVPCSCEPVAVHQENCTYNPEEEIPCDCQPEWLHQEECTWVPATPAMPCNHVHGDCGYEEGACAVACDHLCSEESGCTTSQLMCLHAHDALCGYQPSTEGTPCSFLCSGEVATVAARKNPLGRNLYWSYENGVLTISGTGAMPGYTMENILSRPWNQYSEQIHTVVVEPGVTSIGGHAFSYLFELENLTIADSVRSIGEFAFRKASMAEVIIPENVSEIAAAAFADCWNIRQVRLPRNIREITYAAFVNCTSLEYVTLPEDVEKIDQEAFAGCMQLEGITLPEELGQIHETAFTDCDSLTEITLPEGLEEVGANAFAAFANVEDIYFTGDAPNFGENAFRGVTATVHYPAFNAGWAEAAGRNYGGRITWKPQMPSGELTHGIVWKLDEEGVLTITGTGYMDGMLDDYPAVRPWKDYILNIKKVVLSEGIGNIPNGAFQGCVNLTEVSIPSTVTYIGVNALADCTALTEIVLPTGVETIAFGAFCRSTGLRNVVIPETVTTLGDAAFSGCSGLMEISFMGDCPQMQETTFRNVTAAVSYPADKAGWIDGSKKNYGGMLTWIPIGNMASGELTHGIVWVLDPDGVLTITGIGYMDGMLDDYPADRPWKNHVQNIKKVVLSEGIGNIPNGAFQGCTNLTEIVIPSTVTYIGVNSLANCSTLAEVILPYGVETIACGAFAECTELSEITLPGSVLKIVEYAFAKCYGLSEITFEGDCPELQDNAFYEVLADVYYPASSLTWTENILKNYGGTISWIPYGEPPILPLEITSQPENFVGAINSDAVFSVEVNREDVQYQWYYSSDNGETWYKSGSTGNQTRTLSIQIKDYRLSQLYRCEITDSEGNVVISNAATMLLPPSTIEILHQPVDVYGVPAEQVTFSLTATGEGLSYLWYYSNDGGETWAQSWSAGYTTSVLNPVLRAYSSGRCFKCLITDKNGNTEWSEMAKMELASSEVVIHSQPANYTGKVNDLTGFTVVAEGTNLEYRWYYSDNGGETWQESFNTGYNTDTMQVRLYAYRSGYQYKCVLSSGGVVKAETEPAEIRLLPQTAKIVSHPMNAGGETYQYVTFQVKATGEHLQYQWQYSKDDGETWTNSSGTGSTTDTIEVMVLKGRDGYKYRCQITDESGVPVNSQPATLRVGAVPVITSQPENYEVAVGETAVFTVDATGENIQYQWQYSNNGGSTWNNSGMAGNKTASLNVVATAARNGQMYRCMLTNEYGSIISEAATLTVK